jgi:GAF domain-containing protein
MPVKQSANSTTEGVSDAAPASAEPTHDERKRYTTQLQRRAQAHITAELGGSTVLPDVDRQITMVVQLAQQSTGARRVSFFRPVVRGQRWHVATMFADGSYYYGMASPDALGWSRKAFDDGRQIIFDDRSAPPPNGNSAKAMGIRSYICVPVLVDDKSVAVIEAIDLKESKNLERLADELEDACATVAERLSDQNRQGESPAEPSGRSDLELDADSVVDLILRQPYEVDETFEVAPHEWAVLNRVNGERPLRLVAEEAGLALSQAVSVSIALIERGLLRIGTENRRRL